MNISAKRLLILLLVLIGKFPVLAQNIDEQFNPFIKSVPQVTDLVIQADGKIIIEGDIASVGDKKTSSLVRLLPTGEIDPSFEADVNEYNPYQIAVLANGKVLFRPSSILAQENVIHLNEDGSEDKTFTLSDSIHTIHHYSAQGEKYILATGFWGSSGYRQQIVRINSTGKIDPSFNTLETEGEVTFLEVLNNHKIILTKRVDEHYTIISLHENGDINNIFDAGTGFGAGYPNINTIASQADGKILISGTFETFNGVETGGLIRLNQDGSLDNSFVMPGPTANIFDYGVKCLTVLPSGKLLALGTDYDYYEGNFHVLVRLNQDGSLDTSFSPKKLNIGDGIYAGYISMTSYEDRIYLAGSFETYEEEKRYGIIAIDADGLLIESFEPDIGGNPTVNAALQQADGKIVIAGNFIEINNVETYGIARLYKNGILDTAFVKNIGSGADKTIYSLALQKDNKILVGGGFKQFNNIERSALVRLYPDGTLDGSLEVDVSYHYVSNGVSNISLLEDGKILVGGSLGNINGHERLQVARLDSTGAIDETFAPDLPSNFRLHKMILDNDKIIVGGSKVDNYGHSIGYVAKLSMDGQQDSVFQELELETHSITTIESIEGINLICGGYFISSHGDYDVNPLFQVNNKGEVFDQYSVGSNGFAAFNDILQAFDSTFIVGGSFRLINKFTRFGLAKIDLKGRVYGGFRADISGSVQQILKEDEDHILVFGHFDKVSNIKGFSGVARINISAPRPPMDLSVSVDEARGIQLTWKDSADFETGYKIYRASSNGAGFTLIDSVDAGVTTYLDTNIQPGINYSYQVVSYNDMFQSDFSDPVSVSTSQLNFPETPTELVLEDRNGSVYLTWTAEDANVLGYIVERSTGKEFVVLDTVVINNFYDLEIEINVEYQYRVKAYNVLGDSEYSPVVLYSNEVTGIEAESFEKEHPAYPNPSNSIFIITLEQPVGAENIQIVDMQGKQISLSDVMIQQDNNQLLIDLSGGTKGVYILKINSEQKITSYRLVKR